MSWKLEGRTVLITGAARGIGRESARRLHARGANVALVGLEPERLEELAASLGDRAAAFEADVTDAEALERAVTGAGARFGGIDVAVANAGLHFSGSVLGMPAERFERVLEVNLLGAWRTLRAAGPAVVQRRGYLLAVASLAAASHAPLMGPYSASKAGLEALTDCLRQELRPTGTRVGCAYFGFIDTDLVRGSFEDQAAQRLQSLMPPFVRGAVPVSVAGAAIERGVLRRRTRVWAPGYVWGALAARGVLQPVTEARLRLSRGSVREAMELADTGSGAAVNMRLGVAAGPSAQELPPQPPSPGAQPDADVAPTERVSGS